MKLVECCVEMSATQTIFIFFGFIALVALLIFFMKYKTEPELVGDRKVVVIGQELSDAQALEDERLARVDGYTESVLPAGGYEFLKNEWGLLNPSPQDYDRLLQELCATFSTLKSDSERKAFRESISLEEFYTLTRFAERSAVFALRKKDSEILQVGVNTLAMIDVNRMDWRDVLTTIALLNYCAERLGENPESVFETTASISTPQMADHLRGFVKRDSDSKDLERCWLRREVNLDTTGIGFVTLGGENDYEPTFDLLALGIDIAKVLIADDHYEWTSIELATRLQPIWLRGIDDELVELILSKTRGGMSVRAVESNPEKGTGQMFVVYTVEVDSKKSAQLLLDISRETKLDNGVTLGFVYNNLFSLIVSRSTIMGVESTENHQSIQRFSESIDAVLATAK